MALTVSLDDIIASGNSLLAIKPHWQRVRLGDVGQVLNGYAFKAELFTREGGMPLIRIRDVGSAASETFYSGDYDERYVVNAGDLLVGMDGDFNCARWRGPRSLLNQRVCKITVDEALYLPRFLDYVLPGYLKAINDATSSITVKHLSSRTIQDIPLPLPPMEEQCEIVAELEKQFSRLDEAVANLQRVKANLKRYKASVLKAAVEGRLVETEATLARREGRTYETGEQLLQRVLEGRRAKWTGKGRYKEETPPVDTVGLHVPKGWVIGSAEQVCSSVRDGTHDTPDYVATGVPLITSKNLDEHGIDFENVKFISEKDHVEISKRSAVSVGDILFAMIGTIGNPCEVKTEAKFSIKNVALFKANGECLNPTYFCYWLQSAPLNKWLEPRLKGTTQKFAPLGLLRELPTALPPYAEQARIVAEVDRHLSIIREVEAEVDANLQRAQALRQATLSKAFSRHS